MEGLTVHVDLLGQLNKLHLGGHVAHRTHAVAQVPAVDVAILVLVKFPEGLSELWGREERWVRLGVGPAESLEAKVAQGPTGLENRTRELPRTAHAADAWLHRGCPALYQVPSPGAKVFLPLLPPISLPSVSWMAEHPFPLRGQILPSISSGRSDLS